MVVVYITHSHVTGNWLHKGQTPGKARVRSANVKDTTHIDAQAVRVKAHRERVAVEAPTAVPVAR
jgi:hypothetical protein